MRTVLLVISDLGYHFSSRQLTLLAARLPRSHVCVAVLAKETPWVQLLRQAGVAVEVLGWRRLVDPWPFFALRRLLRSLRPGVVHTWDLPALRTLLLTGGAGAAGLVVSRALPADGSLTWPDGLLLRRADRALALGSHEAAIYRRAGLREDRLVLTAPGITASDRCQPADAIRQALPKLPANARMIVGIGPITWGKGFRDAVWALDILNHVQDFHHLVLIGAAPASRRIGRFARAIGALDRVHFTGPVAELGPWLNRAAVVWVPSWRGGGVGAALEATAAGRPVIASRLPQLAEIVVDGETGFLVPPEDRAALARQTLRLLKDAGMSERMAEAGRQRAQAVFSPEQLVKCCLALYE